MELRIAIPEQHVSEDVLNPALETVTRVNERLIAEGRSPTFDDALKHGVKWRPEPAGQPESFDHGEDVIKRGWGDCDDLAPLAAASMRMSGEDPGAVAVVRPSGPGLWHAYVRRSDGSERDPSVEAGMKRLSGVGPAVVPIMFRALRGIAGEGPRPSIALRRIVTPSGVVGFDARVDVPMTDSDFAMSTLERRRVASQAIIGAILGACTAGECGEYADDEHLARLYAIAGLIEGEDPRRLAVVLGRSAVVGAIPFVGTLAQAGSDALPVAWSTLGQARSLETSWSVVGGGVGWDFFKSVSHAVKDVGHTVSSVTHTLQPVLNVAKTVLSAAQGVISLIPGIGTGISAAIGAALAVLDGGGPIEIAMRTALGAIPIPPGLRQLADTVFDAVAGLVRTGFNATEGAIAAIKGRFPAGLLRDIFDTLVHIAMRALHKAPTHAVATPKPGVPTGSPVQLVKFTLDVAPPSGFRVYENAMIAPVAA